MKVLLIMNPGSRAGRGRRRWAAWEDGLRRTGVSYTCAPTREVGHAFRLARDAEGYDVVVAVGGDGTINEVMDGVLQSAMPSTAVGILYSGTSPDFCRFHGVPVEPAAAVAALSRGETRAVDVVRITYRDAEGTEQVAHFGCGCNIGLGAAVARHSNRIRRFTGDGPGTALALLRAVRHGRPADLDLVIDGQPHPLARVNNLSVLKSGYIASGLRVNLDVGPCDGQLGVLAVHGLSFWGLLRLIPGFYTGRAAEADGIFRTNGRHLTVASQTRQELEFDGDPRGYLPAEMDVMVRALHLVGGADA